MSHDVAIEAVGLAKTFHDPRRGPVEAVKGIDLSCRRGEIYGLLGPNGAGKTTTLRMLATILAPSAGRAAIDGVEITADPIEVRRRLGFLSGTTGLYPRLTARETLTYFGGLHGIERTRLERRVEELLDLFEIRPFANARCEHLSTGQKQRVSIARTLVHDPPVLILDEPTSGLDVLAAGTMIELIRGRREAGGCVLFSTHVLSEAERLCDRIGIVFGGRMLASGTLEELRAQSGKHWLEEVFRELVLRAGEQFAEQIV